jgi:hypothetical protein
MYGIIDGRIFLGPSNPWHALLTFTMLIAAAKER